MEKRIEKLKNKALSNKDEAILISKPANRVYYAYFTGTAGYIYVDKKDCFFLTDSRYMEQARRQCSGFEIVELNNDLTIYDFIKDKKLKRLFVEENTITMSQYIKLKESLKNGLVLGLEAIIGKQRMVKDAIEIENIGRAAKIADKAFSHILEFIRPGLTEKEIALELELFMRKGGAEGLSFETIVASGIRSSMPHGAPTDKRLEKGEFITMDFGCVVEGYCSDMTRTIHLGPAKEEEKKLYGIVLKAQLKAMEYIRAGSCANSVDRIARDIIIDNGYGSYFGHGLGHGVGLEIHEEPFLSPKGDEILRSGMVLTDEPGIYLPGKFGVRIEDLLLVKEKGCEILSNSTKEFIEI